MTVGFKTGPKTWAEGKEIVKEHRATFCEIWFNVLRADEYAEPLKWFVDRGVGLGLHHWGVVDDLKPNYATTNKDLRERTLAQMKECIDLGVQYEAGYVNIHPSARVIEKQNVDIGEQSPLPDTDTPEATYQELLIAGSVELHEYAKERGVTLTIETIPHREQHKHLDRSSTYDPGNATLADSRAIAAAGCNIANDITHTVAAVAPSCPADSISECMTVALEDFVTDTVASTKLVHVNTMVAPFDGTDTHDGIRDIDFATGVYPDKELVLKVLATFKDRDDVFIIPEPRDTMGDNYAALVDLVSSL